MKPGHDRKRNLIRKSRRKSKKKKRLFQSSILFYSPFPQEKAAGSPPVNLLLLRELLLSDARTPQLNVQHALHGTEDLLVRSGGTALEVLNNGDGGVALSGEFLLSHLVAFLVSALLDRIRHLVADGLGLDDVVAAVDLGQVLAFGGTGASSLFKFCVSLALSLFFFLAKLKGK